MSSTEKSLKASLILEIIGRPKEHLIQALEDIIKKIDDEKGVSVKTKNIPGPKPMKDQKDLFTTYAEVEVEVEEAIFLAILMFKYMPAHIEIIYPEKLVFQNNYFSEILNELTRRLHGYEELARMMLAEKKAMETKIQELQDSNSKKSSKKK